MDKTQREKCAGSLGNEKTGVMMKLNLQLVFIIGCSRVSRPICPLDLDIHKLDFEN